jgi:hypothetical protein
MKAIPHPIDVLDIRRERDVLGSNAIRRPPAPALVVVDEVVRIGQPIEVGQQVSDVEIRAPVEYDDGRAVSDVSDVERRIADGDAALVRCGRRALPRLERGCRIGRCRKLNACGEADEEDSSHDA